MSSPAIVPQAAFPEGCDNVPLVSFIALVVSLVNSRLEAERGRRFIESAAQPAEETYDFVVVGGGASGCVIASRLSELADVRVLLLERGGTEPPEARVPGFRAYVIQGQVGDSLQAVAEPENCNGEGCLFVVPSLLGGGATLNAMMYVRGSSVDYDNWADILGDPGWNYTNVLPYFKRSEKNLDLRTGGNLTYHGTDGPMHVAWESYRHPSVRLIADAFTAAGVPFRLDINGEGELGHTVVQTTTAQGERWSTYRSHLEPVLDRPNLRVITYATATRILFDNATGDAQPRASGVQYRDAAGRVHVARATREVVVTAGTFNTPHLLMLSGIGPAAQLQALNISVRADLPVGEGLMDHPRPEGLAIDCRWPLCETGLTDRLIDLMQYASSRSGPLTNDGMIWQGAFLRTDVNPPPPNGTGLPAQRPDLQIMFAATDVNPEGYTCVAADSWRFNRIKLSPVTLHPLSRGTVRLNPDDPEGLPLVRMGYYTDPEGQDIAVAVEGYRLMLQVANLLTNANTGLSLSHDPKLAPSCNDLPYASDAMLRCWARTTTASVWHWAGTCRMGNATDPNAVTDSRLRVRGVQALRVADASTMPTMPSGNTNAPTIMIAERAADIIKEDNGLPTTAA